MVQPAGVLVMGSGRNEFHCFALVKQARYHVGLKILLVEFSHAKCTSESEWPVTSK